MDNKDEDKPKEKVVKKYVLRTPVDVQRIKLEKLMENPVKTIFSLL